MRYAMIMAGGKGTRLWPMSREDRPKQLLDFIEQPAGENGEGGLRRVSLLRLAASRLEGLVPAERRFVCTGERYRAAVREALPEFSDDRILGEPEGRDTVNAVGFGAAVFAKMDPEAVFAVLTADHLIEPDAVFRKAMEVGFALVEQDPNRLVTFAIRPTYAATGFGYVEQDSQIPGTDGLGFNVARFVEKPDLPRAQAYLESGAFFWNAGMFIFKARTFLRLLEQHKPESHAGLARIAEAWGTPEQERVVSEVYPTLPKISVDYAVMEPAAKDPSVQICGVKMDVDWLDVGSWPSFGETVRTDAARNRLARPGSAALTDSEGNLVVTSQAGHTVALLGCRDLIVVQTPDATLIMPRSKAEDLKKLHATLPESLK